MDLIISNNSRSEWVISIILLNNTNVLFFTLQIERLQNLGICFKEEILDWSIESGWSSLESGIVGYFSETFRISVDNHISIFIRKTGRRWVDNEESETCWYFIILARFFIRSYLSSILDGSERSRKMDSFHIGEFTFLIR